MTATLPAQSNQPAAPGATPFRYSRGARITDAKPEQREAATFDAFVDALEADRSPAKGLSYICGPLGSDGRRCTENAQPRAWIPLDADKLTPAGVPSFEAWLGEFSAASWPTHSSTDDAPRRRGLIEASRPMDRAECLVLGPMLAEALALTCDAELDASTHKPEQALYTVPTGAAITRHRGAPLDVDAWLSRAREAAQTADAFEAAVDAPRPKKSRTEVLREVYARDHVLKLLIAADMVKSYAPDGSANIVCPNAIQHTTASAETSTRYYPEHTGGRAAAAIVCNHGHCGHMTQAAFFALIPGIESAPAASHLDYYAHLPDHKYIHRPTGVLFPAASVDGHLKDKIDEMRPSAWLDQHRAVHQMTWAPGAPEVIEDQVVDGGGLMVAPGSSLYNRYRAPTVIPGDARLVDLWRQHLRTIYPEEAPHIERWLAHRIQRPAEKLNHALVLAGAQGIGKDSLLDPVKRAIGRANWKEIDVEALFKQFNAFVQSVVLRISEARDMGDANLFSTYERTKVIIAAPPDVLMCNEKFLPQFPVLNVTGVIITTNHALNGLYIPADDRRHFVASSHRNKEDFGPEYWNDFWAWLESGGAANVAAYLRELDLTGFDPKAKPPRTEGFDAMVAAGADMRDAPLVDLIEKMGRPAALTLSDVRDACDAVAIDEDGEIFATFSQASKRKHASILLAAVGYVPVSNRAAKDGLWRVDGKRQVIYGVAKSDPGGRVSAALRRVEVGVGRQGSTR